MNKYLTDVDDYYDEKNRTDNDDTRPIDDVIEEMVDSILEEQDENYWENCDKGAKIIEVHGKKVFFELYEKRVRGRGYKYEKKPEDFHFRISSIKYAYAIDGDLHVCKKPRIGYTIPNIEKVDLLAFLINRQIGVCSDVEESESTE